MRYLPTKSICEVNLSCSKKLQHDLEKEKRALLLPGSQRGVERKEYGFKDGTTGDVYRCVLLAMKTDPPRLSFKYEDMLRRVEGVCSGDQPSGSSVNQALEQMTNIARIVQEAPILEWAEGITSIATVHDSFGCLPSRAERFRKIIREQFVRMYEEHDVLAEALEQARKDLNEPNTKRMSSAPPSRASLDIKNVLDAEFAFA